jgi:hypothetical protein
MARPYTAITGFHIFEGGGGAQQRRSSSPCLLPATRSPNAALRQLSEMVEEDHDEPGRTGSEILESLEVNMTMMLGISGIDESHTRPMTAQLEGEASGPIWFFTAKDNDLCCSFVERIARCSDLRFQGPRCFRRSARQPSCGHRQGSGRTALEPLRGSLGRRRRTTRSSRCCGSIRRGAGLG